MVLDVLTAFVLITHTTFGWFSTETILYHAAYIIIKGGMFAFQDHASKIDVLTGIYIVISALDIFTSTTITILSAMWLMQKALFAAINWIIRVFF